MCILLPKTAKDGITDEVQGHGAAIFSEVAKSQWNSCCIQHTNVQRMCEPCPSFFPLLLETEPPRGVRRAMIIDLSLTGSQLIASVLHTADKDQRAALYDCICVHIVTLRGCKTGSKIIWLFDRMRAHYGF
ncbi:hypothetical protein DFH09DRAFT_1354646 [Mycena vulgaris]|nr:hypothetical protein DFH09DRAFT_1354646 [Mycena vulgaris]